MKPLLTLLLMAWASLGRAESVTLAWECSPSPDVNGYRIYYGTNSHSYQFVTNTSLVRTQTVVLPHAGRWYFAATSTAASGAESAYSGEVEWEVRPAPPVLHGETWVRLTPVIGRSTNLLEWVDWAGAPTWLPATNAQEFFRSGRLRIERVELLEEP